MSIGLLWALGAVCAPAFVHAAQDVALVTSLAGKVNLEAGASSAGNRAVALEAFVKLKQGDILTLSDTTRLQITYFANGRQESWAGTGKLEILGEESKGHNLAAPEVKSVPLLVVKQLARTPALDSQGRAGVVRLRSIPTPEAVAQVETTYRQLRESAAKGDLNPELYLLAGMLQLRQFERVASTLDEMKKTHPGDPEVKLLTALYGKAVSDLKAADSGSRQAPP